LLGRPEARQEQFRKGLQGATKPTRARDGKMKHKPLEFLYERFTKFIEDRRQKPRDDVMTKLAHATFPDGTLPEVHDIMLIASNLFSAGGETRAGLLGVMFQKIGEDPELQQRLRDDRTLIPRLGEECLRLGTPLQCTFRISRVRTEIGGIEFPPGTTVMLLPAAANLDPRVF